MNEKSHRVRVGVQIHPQHATYGSIRETVVAVEEMGADIVYNWDHFYPLYGDARGAHFEAWTMLGAWAEQTSTIEIGCLVTCNSYRNPHLLADMSRTVDHISGGRLSLGIGSGWFRRDYDEYGFEFGTKGSRLDALGRDLPLIRARWEKLNPLPLRRIPIVIGGLGLKKTTRLVAKHADTWHAMFPRTPGELVPAVEALEYWCQEESRDPRSIEWAIGLEPDEGLQVLETYADQYLEMGFTQFTFGTNGPDYSLDGLQEWLRWRDERNRAS
jgi:probable F420-dependent oxidoreductase